MQKHEIRIDMGKCVGCKLCMSDCVSRNIRIADGRAQLIGNNCIMCGHCVAICPEGAVSISGFEEAPVPIEKSASLQPDEVLNVIRNRRTIRQFQNRSVPTEVVNQILEAGRLTHTARNGQGLTFIVLDKQKEVAERTAVQLFQRLQKNAGIFSSMIRAQEIVDAFFFFRAPLVIVISGRSTVDASLSAQNMEFVAEANGLGTLISGFFSIAVRISGKLRKLLEVPKGKKALVTLVMGYPKIKYQRSAQREKLDVIYK